MKAWLNELKLVSLPHLKRKETWDRKRITKMEKRWVSVREASRYLSIHETTVRRLIDYGVIPASRIGRNVRVDMRKLNEQLERDMVPERGDWTRR